MKHLFSHEELPKDMMPRVYEIMVAAATVDLHWEVKMKSLDFWEEVIWERLRNQGVIDGAFPEVTFSKEQRKIVTLTQLEIQKRLTRVLLELSGNGCLGVLVSAMQDECDIQVVERAVDITKKLMDFLRKYAVISYEDVKLHCVRSPSAKGERFDFGISSSAVLEISGVKKVAPKEFFDFIKQDLSKLVENKRVWLRNMDNLESVLDDMLKECDDHDDDDDMNRMDCY